LRKYNEKVLFVHDNSIKAYDELKDNNYLTDNQKIVYDFLKNNPESTREVISKFTGLTINCVCGRVDELRSLGFIKENGNVVNQRSGKCNSVLSLGKEKKKDCLSDVQVRNLEKKLILANTFQLLRLQRVINHLLCVKSNGISCRVCGKYNFLSGRNKDICVDCEEKVGL